MRDAVRHVFFDLDGTLADSAEGIVSGLSRAARRVAGAAPPAETLRATIGRPLDRIFLELLGDAALARRAVAAYQQDFDRVVLPAQRLYAGIGEVLEDLAGRGCALHVVTAKRHDAALRAVAQLGLRCRVAGIYGIDEAAGRRDKVEALSAALSGQGASVGEAAMVGDRREDVDAARRNGVRAVAVSWGYGSLEELRRARPDALLHRPDELPGALAAD